MFIWVSVCCLIFRIWSCDFQPLQTCRCGCCIEFWNYHLIALAPRDWKNWKNIEEKSFIFHWRKERVWRRCKRTNQTPDELKCTSNNALNCFVSIYIQTMAANQQSLCHPSHKTIIFTLCPEISRAKTLVTFTAAETVSFCEWSE